MLEASNFKHCIDLSELIFVKGTNQETTFLVNPIYFMTCRCWCSTTTSLFTNGRYLVSFCMWTCGVGGWYHWPNMFMTIFDHKMRDPCWLLLVYKKKLARICHFVAVLRLPHKRQTSGWCSFGMVWSTCSSIGQFVKKWKVRLSPLK